jgi:integrase
MFRRHVYEAFPHLADASAAEIQARDVAAMTRALIEAKKERTAGKLRSYLAAAFALALRAETDPTAPADALVFKVPANPAQATKPHSGIRSRDRTLTEAELRHYMRRVTSIDSDVQRDVLMLLLLLGGQRPAQLLRATVGDIDLAAGTILLRDPKGKREEPRLHKLPLQGAALEMVKRRIAAAESQSKKRKEKNVNGEDVPVGNVLLFSVHGKAAVRLETLSVRVSEIAEKMVKAHESRSRFQLRDLRRTAETMLASMKVSKDTRARLLSHGISGVQDKHYDFHSYAPEMTAALEAWERWLSKIAEGEEHLDNVVLLTRKA